MGAQNDKRLTCQVRHADVHGHLCRGGRRSTAPKPKRTEHVRLKPVSMNETYTENRTLSNGNEPIAEADTVIPMQTGQTRADANYACSVNATNDDDDGTTVANDDDDDGTTVEFYDTEEEKYLKDTRRVNHSDEWEAKRPKAKRSGRKAKGLKVSFGCSCGEPRPLASYEPRNGTNDAHNENHTANAKHTANLQALEEKRRLRSRQHWFV